ncbi:MAG TPA: DEAD/DEAH box helicase family protein [Candidatus Eisenbergiella merdipullorum]|uniref:DEAD/DEAH box helicase family protein n=1 Tax=Candidatus Eisenbergiella merdipullorum TaxID=2838553 RepID=A0A9D2I3L6_9FIRM|nr:DEAD/DEAH box helicase family protein [Candidatus Eisenbergiella merdipullorum]
MAAEGNVFDGILEFGGTWRSYQKRILDEADVYLKDGKVHIVAAPGAGKTTLGIELIRRVGKPCLILSPRIVIRQQWLERIEGSFLADSVSDGCLSNDIRKPGLVTSLTYQTLFCAMNRKEETEEDGDGAYREQTDFRDFSFLEKVREAGVGTICLDECHHLKNEWWKALEVFMAEMKGAAVIALTATPPYDSAPAQWERYIRMCGPIDAEITIPELVKEGSLCPHQDYVWFNYPDREEEKKINGFRKEADAMYRELLADEKLKEAAASHRGLPDYEGNVDRMLEDPGYLSALLIYCRSAGIFFPEKWRKVLTVRKLPEMSEAWMEKFLQGFLFDDTDSYSCSAEYRESLIRRLKAAGLIEKRKVSFLVNAKIEKMLINSRGKLDSIRQIAELEYRSMGNRLRLLILTDYIRGEYRSAVGAPEKEIRSIGVLPVFELLRRQEKGWKLGILCGSMVVIPKDAVGAFARQAGIAEEKLLVSCRTLTGREEGKTGYVEVEAGGKLPLYTRVMTALFEEGEIEILVGTKSLLGEGWDAPCVNTLILASFVGSYVLGNQMRGRAIRIYEKVPDKVSNIWHLVCLSSPREEGEKRLSGIPDPALSEDFCTLGRRMEGILGLSYDGTTIENGMERLTVIRPPYTRKHVEGINREMAIRSGRRDTVAKQWKDAVSVYEKMDVADECAAGKETLRPGMIFVNALAVQLLLIALEALNILGSISPGSFSGRARLFYLGTVLFALGTVFLGGRIVKYLTPQRYFSAIGKGMLNVLKKAGEITSECAVKTKEEEGYLFAAWLKGGTDREKTVFADSLTQMLSPVDNQRYLLCQGRGAIFGHYYCVPQLFSGSREKAEAFRKGMEPWIGRYRLVYTRNPEGRKILLKGRARAFANKNERRLCRRKKVKSALE